MRTLVALHLMPPKESRIHSRKHKKTDSIRALAAETPERQIASPERQISSTQKESLRALAAWPSRPHLDAHHVLQAQGLRCPHLGSCQAAARLHQLRQAREEGGKGGGVSM